MTLLYPFWCNNGGPLNRKIAVQINSLLLKLKALNSAWVVLSKHSFESEEKTKVIFLVVVPL